MAKKIKKFNTPEDVVKALANAKCCRDVLPEYSISYWLDQYIWRVGVDKVATEEAKASIVYALMFMLNELKSMTNEKLLQYILEPDVMLEEVIAFGEKRGWTLDKHSAIGLCAYIAEDYIYDPGDLHYTSAKGKSALEQIIAGYPDKVITDIYDPAWEVYYNNLISEHLEDEDAIYAYHNIDALRMAVRQRECMPLELVYG